MNRLILFLFLGAFSICSWATPAAILLIRHAEKPDYGSELSEKGWARAKALPQIFSRNPFKAFGTPACLIGMAPKKYDGSVRALQTLKYVSEYFNMKINDTFNKDERVEMVNYILNSKDCDGGMLVISWEHNSLEDIAQQIGIEPKPNWPGQSYDRIWFLKPGPTGWQMSDLPQNLLPGDSAI